VIATGTVEDLRKIINARLFPVAAEIVDGDMLMVRFAGNEKGVAYQIEQARALLKNAEVVTDDASVWKGITRGESRPQLSAGERALMQRIKKQLDPLGTLPDILAAD
jgi:FAD/FMN-containing dehydrogenase